MTAEFAKEVHRVALELKIEQRRLARAQRQAKRACQRAKKRVVAANHALAGKHSHLLATRARIERLDAHRAEPVDLGSQALVILWGAGPLAVVAALAWFVSRWPR